MAALRNKRFGLPSMSDFSDCNRLERDRCRAASEPLEDRALPRRTEIYNRSARFSSRRNSFRHKLFVARMAMDLRLSTT
jgi:hypothetical protein